MGIGEVYSALELYVSRLDLEKMIDYSLHSGGDCVKRLGWILDKEIRGDRLSRLGLHGD